MMIDDTQKKLREARFFLNKLESEHKRAVRNEPEAFGFYMSAFLSAARSVTFALQKEEKQKYDQWFPGWLAARGEDERELLALMTEQRNQEQKEGGGTRRAEWECIPVTELSREELGGQVFWSAPVGVPEPQVGRLVHYFVRGGEESEALSACIRYYDLLAELVETFMKEHS